VSVLATGSTDKRAGLDIPKKKSHTPSSTTTLFLAEFRHEKNQNRIIQVYYIGSDNNIA
jgi:hypothetical protein